MIVPRSRLRALLMCLCLAAIACGGGNPAQPSGSRSVLDQDRRHEGTLTCLVDGVSYLSRQRSELRERHLETSRAIMPRSPSR